MPLADRDLHYEIEQFLYWEACLLDEARFHEWLDLFTEDARYWMPVRQTIQGRPEGNYGEGQFAVNYFNEDLAQLAARVKRLDTGLAHAETPPSRTRRLITNVRVHVDASDGITPAPSTGEEPALSLSTGWGVGGSPGDLVTAYSNFTLYQGRHQRSERQFFGRREDRLRRVGGDWKICHRTIILDHTILPRSLTVFF